MNLFAQHKTLEEMKALLRNVNLRITVTRLTILHILQSAQRELTAAEILYSQYKPVKKLSSAGVYHTLKQLEQAGLVFKFKHGDEQALYSFKNNQARIRISCKKCRRLEQMTDRLLELQIQELMLLHHTGSYHLTLERQSCSYCTDETCKNMDIDIFTEA